MDQKSPEAFRTISEVAEWLGVPTHVLRFWESRFSQVKPVKRAGGRRYYRPADMELLGGIRQLLHEDGMTIRGVQKLLREQGVKHVAGMSPPLDLSAETEDVTPSNVVDLSERRVEEAEEADDSAWAASGEPEAELPDETVTGEAPEVEPDAWTTGDAAAPDEAPAPDWPEDDAAALDDADLFESPEQVAFHAHDAEPDAFEGAEMDAAPPPADFTPPTPDPEPAADTHTASDPMDSPEALDFAAHEAPPEATDAGPPAPAEIPAPPPAPARQPIALEMPDIGPDPDDGAFYPDVPPVAAELRALRAAGLDVPVETLWALADRLGTLAARIGTQTPPRG